MITGIHHLALTVPDDVRYRILTHPKSGMVIGLRDPDNIQLEFWLPAG